MYNCEFAKARDLAYGRLLRKSMKWTDWTKRGKSVKREAPGTYRQTIKLCSFSNRMAKKGDFADKKVRSRNITFKKSGNDSLVQAVISEYIALISC